MIHTLRSRRLFWQQDSMQTAMHQSQAAQPNTQHIVSPSSTTCSARVSQAAREAVAAARAAAEAGEQQAAREHQRRDAAAAELAAAQAEHARWLKAAAAEKAPLEAERTTLLASIEVRPYTRRFTL